jgi:hypothetical protein
MIKVVQCSYISINWVYSVTTFYILLSITLNIVFDLKCTEYFLSFFLFIWKCSSNKDFMKVFIFRVFCIYFVVLIRFQVLKLLSMNLVQEQVTGLLSYLVHLMKLKQHRAFSKHLFLMDHHDIYPQGLSSRSYVTYWLYCFILFLSPPKIM